MTARVLTPGTVTLGVLRSARRTDAPVRLDRTARGAVEASARHVEDAAAGEHAVYGVNTGFGEARDGQDCAGRHCHAAAQPHPFALERGGLADSSGHHPADDGAEAAVARAGRVRRALGRDRADRGDGEPARASGRAGSGVGGRVGRSRAARPSGGGDDRRGGGDVRRPHASRLDRPVRGGTRAGRACGKGRSRAHQRHAVLDRPRARGAVRGMAQRRSRGCDLVPGDRRDDGVHRATPSRDSRAARSPRPDRRRACDAVSHVRLRNQGEPPRRRRARPGCILRAVPATGHRRVRRAAPSRRAHAFHRGQCRHRQPARARPGGRHSLGGQLPRRTRGVRGRPNRARNRRNRLNRPAPRGVDGRPRAVVRPAALPHSESRTELRVHERGDRHGGPDEREQASRHSLLDRFGRRPAPIRRTMCRWPHTARAGWRG